LGGLILGPGGFFFPQLLGIGCGAINLALTQELTWGRMFLLVIGKILATSITIGSGVIFAPALFGGTMANKRNQPHEEPSVSKNSDHPVFNSADFFGFDALQ
jgi:hypothetical protein